jgi:glycogen debranching enzyme
MANDTDLIILDGCTFFYSSGNGDVEERAPSGFFYRDVRHLAVWKLTVDGDEVEPISSRRIDYYSARVVATPSQKGTAAPISLRRDRFVTEGVHEDVVLENLTEQQHEVRLELSFGADFADVMEAEANDNGKGKRWVETNSLSATLWNERDGYRRGTKIRFNKKGRITKSRAVFRVRLRARETWKLCVDMSPLVDGAARPPLLRCESFHDHAPKMPVSLDQWRREAPDLRTEYGPLRRAYRQSILDIAALRVRPDDVSIKWAMPGGGLPWFMTIFGRDSIVTAYQALPFHAELAQATLQALAELQATEWDSWRDAEPGKIPHELRRGTLAATGRIPHTPYYGSHDSTALWLILLDEYERWTGDVAFVRRMEQNARAALGWLDGPADLDGDGYIEYRKRSSSDHALDNHCWKDSKESIVFADGRRAEPPIAVCEHQRTRATTRSRTTTDRLAARQRDRRRRDAALRVPRRGRARVRGADRRGRSVRGPAPRGLRRVRARRRRHARRVPGGAEAAVVGRRSAADGDPDAARPRRRERSSSRAPVRVEEDREAPPRKRAGAGEPRRRAVTGATRR